MSATWIRMRTANQFQLEPFISQWAGSQYTVLILQNLSSWTPSIKRLPFRSRSRRMTDAAYPMAGAEGALPEVLFPAPVTDYAG